MQKISESRIQQDFFTWLWNTYPRTRGLCYHIPNGGLRTARESMALKAMGVVPGIPDIHIAIAAMGYNSIYIEFKEPDYNNRDKHVLMQLEAHKRLEAAGNLVVICTSSDEAQGYVTRYLLNSEYMLKN